MLILLINAGLFVATEIFCIKLGVSRGFGDIDGRVLYAFGAKIGLQDLDGQWWRLVTAGFLHGGLLHILMNSWVLFDLGAQVEAIYGAARMWVIYFLATVAGFYASAVFNPGLSIGASAGLVRSDRRHDRPGSAASQPGRRRRPRHVHSLGSLHPDLGPFDAGGG
jgi:rhomboid protease GluP